MGSILKYAFLALTLCQVNCLYTENDDVVVLTEENFDQKVLNCGALWIVEFYAPWCGHCKNLVPEFLKAAKAMKGVVRFGVVDATVEKNLGNKYHVNRYPTLKVFGADKEATPMDYPGGRTFKAFVEFSMTEIKKRVEAQSEEEVTVEEEAPQQEEAEPAKETDVIVLTDDNFEEIVLKSEEPFLVEFFAPWCGHCKRLAPEWEIVASELKGKVKVGALDGTSNRLKMTEYQIRGYPSIKYFQNGEVEDYKSARSAVAITKFALSKLSAATEDENNHAENDEL